ncbi:MAG: glycosyltransferase family 2 protein [Eubacteriales bacterium]|nr:glycosyltransferase family 2 protein [Eubacteriales bacterium]
MEQKKPLVTVILPTHDHAPFISRAVESILAQKTTFPFDILIHDDASGDGTTEIVKNYAAKYPDKITLIAQTVNQYKTDKKIQTHILYPRITAKYTAICDGDDLWTDENKLQLQVDYLENHPGCTLCICGADKIDVAGRIIGMSAPYKEDCVVAMEDMIRAGGEFCSSNTIVAPTALLNSQPDFCELTEVEDIPVHMWCAVNGYAWYFSKHMAAYRYAVPGSWSMRQNAAKRETQIATCRGVIGLLEGFDAYTKERYHASFADAILYQKFKIKCFERDLKALRRPPYRVFYRELSGKRRIRLWLERYFPGLTQRGIALIRKVRNR